MHLRLTPVLPDAGHLAARRSVPPAAPVLGHVRTTTEKEAAMTDHTIGTRDEWLAAREELLRREKSRPGYYPILERAPKGRDEEGSSEFWIRRHDEYDLEARR
jgi:hypothetical protein